MSAQEFEQQKAQRMLAGDGGNSLKTAGQKEPAKGKMFLTANRGYLEKCAHGISTDSLTKKPILLFISAKLIICPFLVCLILPAPAVNTAHEYDPITNISFMVLTIDGKKFNV